MLLLRTPTDEHQECSTVTGGVQDRVYPGWYSRERYWSACWVPRVVYSREGAPLRRVSLRLWERGCTSAQSLPPSPCVRAATMRKVSSFLPVLERRRCAECLPSSRVRAATMRRGHRFSHETGRQRCAECHRFFHETGKNDAQSVIDSPMKPAGRRCAERHRFFRRTAATLRRVLPFFGVSSLPWVLPWVEYSQLS